VPLSFGTRRPKGEFDNGPTSRLTKPKLEVEEAAWTPPLEYQVGQLRFSAADDPKDFPSSRAAMLVSFNNVLPATDDLAEASSRYEVKKEAAVLRATSTSLSRWRTFHRAALAIPAKVAAPS
jgi:hypothetical protein